MIHFNTHYKGIFMLHTIVIMYIYFFNAYILVHIINPSSGDESFRWNVTTWRKPGQIWINTK